MTTPTILIDGFVGIALAANTIAFFFLYFMQRRYTESRIVRPLRILVFNTVIAQTSIVTIWLVERNIASQPSVQWVSVGLLGLNLVCITSAWLWLKKLRAHPHLARLTAALPYVLGFVALVFCLQIVSAFQPLGVGGVIARGATGVAAILCLAFGAARARSQYPGAGMEALFIICSVATLVVGATFVGQMNGRTESIVIENQTKVFQEFIARQSEMHLTAKAFIPKSEEGQKEITNFVEQFTTATTKRVYVILPDGLIIGSDVADRVNTRTTIDEDIAQGLKSIGTVRYVPTSNSLPESEKSLGSAMIVTMPLHVNSGQGTLGVLRLFLDGSTTDIAAAGLQARAVGFAVFYILLTQVFLFAFFLIFRKTISHPFAELQDELKNVHEVSIETGENRRLAVKAGGPFQKLADSINRIINEDEQRIRDLKHTMEEKGWHE
ncbi:MAG: hypothetical protein WCV85_05300 [Patescibacteria group bacterium]|jgi:hypothetical protein